MTKNPGWLGYIGDYTTQFYGKANIRIFVNQWGFHGMSSQGFEHCLITSTTSFSKGEAWSIVPSIGKNDLCTLWSEVSQIWLVIFYGFEPWDSSPFFTPMLGICLHIFFPTTSSKSKNLKFILDPTLSETNSSHLKHCWKISFLWGRPFLKGEMLVSGRVFFFPLTRKKQLSGISSLGWILGYCATSSNQHDLKLTDRRLTKSISKGFIGGK